MKEFSGGVGVEGLRGPRSLNQLHIVELRTDTFGKRGQLHAFKHQNIYSISRAWSFDLCWLLFQVDLSLPASVGDYVVALLVWWYIRVIW